MTACEIIPIGSGRLLVVEAGKGADGLHAVLNRSANGIWTRVWVSPGTTIAHNAYGRDFAQRKPRAETTLSVEEWLTGDPTELATALGIAA